MAALSWNEIKTRAASFVNEWKEKAPLAREEADAQTFEIDFFNIFGVSTKQVAIFEHKVPLDNGGGTDLFGGILGGGKKGYIDLLWRGHILIEMKSPGKDLAKAYEQARAYANGLPAKDLPKGILICDFINFHYYNLEEEAAAGGKLYKFTITELLNYIELFGNLAGYKDVVYKKFDPVNIEAAEQMGKLHDHLKEIGYTGYQLEVYLVRLLFCLFADDTGIFEHDHFIKYIVERTNPDGKDLAMHIDMIFKILNKPNESRLKTLDEQLNKFPFINGSLFDEQLDTADFDSEMREKLIDCCRLDWSKISPAIFGAMFQSVMNDEVRHDIGAHYTSEDNILKVIHPLFLDDLKAEFEKIKTLKSDPRIARLEEFHNKLANLKFLDPACGCGNFLVISYRELRLLEIEVIKELLQGEKLLDVDHYIKVNVNQFYGIEIVEFPSKVAQTAMWLMDHQMNMMVRETFGEYYIRIPLTTSASIHNKNALPLDWETVVAKNELSYILGNPPFLGKKEQSRHQKCDLERIFKDTKKNGILDYVACWYKKAAEYIKDTKIEVAFVSTNSICQGEQVLILWESLINTYGIAINFAHQTFKWWNEARGKAAVHCVIIGFSCFERPEKKLYFYPDVKGIAVESSVDQINAYLVNAPMIFVKSRKKAICKVPELNYGSMPIDNGNLILEKGIASLIIRENPEMKNVIRRYYGGDEFINDKKRYCFWFKDADLNLIKKSRVTKALVERTKKFREASSRKETIKLSETPYLFGEIRQPDKDYLFIPKVSSENRKYIPIGFLTKINIANGSALISPQAGLYEFGILTSRIHNAWMRAVGGRLELRYQYSASLVYNNFPWPTPTEKQKEAIKTAAQAVLTARKLYPKDNLATLYDPIKMPPELTKAHNKLDKVVEKAYGREFDDDAQRVAYLFELYQIKSGELFVDTKKRGKGRKI
ncbi:methylase [Spirochaetia bacterium]|nr:methylase [Spirochaetia bacterium]